MNWWWTVHERLFIWPTMWTFQELLMNCSWTIFFSWQVLEQFMNCDDELYFMNQQCEYFMNFSWTFMNVHEQFIKSWTTFHRGGGGGGGGGVKKCFFFRKTIFFSFHVLFQNKQNFVVLASVGGRSRATELPCCKLKYIFIMCNSIIPKHQRCIKIHEINLIKPCMQYLLMHIQ